MPTSEIVVHSGGQTGVDRAALDAALSAGVRVGGWCPRGRRAEDGPISERYPLRETPTTVYAERTAWNVRDADGTLLLTRGTPTGGTALTADLARRSNKPLLCVDLEDEPDVESVVAWLKAQEIRVLNVAGPRESTAPGIYEEARRFVAQLLHTLAAD